MSFKSNPIALTTVDQDIFTMGAALEGAALVGVVNATAAPVNYTLKFYKQGTGATTAFAAIAVPANSAVKFPMALAMETGDKITMSAAANASLTAFVTVNTSASSAQKGFTPKGNYSAGATYDQNDVVYNAADGNSYVSVQGVNTGHDPATATAWWMIFGKKGDKGNDGTGTGNVNTTGAAVLNHVVVYADTTGNSIKDGGVVLGDAAAKNTGAVAGTLAAGDDTRIVNAARKDQANIFAKTQIAHAQAMTSGVAPDYTAGQSYTVNVNGSSFSIPNPTAAPAEDGAYIAFFVTYTTANALAFGTKYKGLAGYTASTSGDDHLIFRYKLASDTYALVGVRNGVSA